ncbi:MAG TPA: tRNA (guanosine(37)-N1)-methyltransferase TrmD [Microthrixaceae bacterium]|nr:tRNA (guanosine(37)-N1)-methyltransferase TrmD [Microthrixaceae bacterium]
MDSSNSSTEASADDASVIERSAEFERPTPLRIDVLTIFPPMVEQFSEHSLIGRAIKDERLDLRVHDIRDATDDVHRTVDDSPFGGGAGMVMKAGPIFDTVERAEPQRPLLLLGPGGRRLDQAYAAELAAGPGFSLLCGRYEGIDARVHDHLVDGELSIGDYVLSGGEVAAMVVIEAVGRLIPGVMGNDFSASEESFSEGLLEYPQYTRPAEFRGFEVPDVLRSGDHSKVKRWRLAKSLEKTIRARPDLIEARGGLSAAEMKILAEFAPETAAALVAE